MDNEFLIKFGGENHIRVETLTEYLDKYSQLLYKINLNIGLSQNDLIIEVSPPETGSFKIKISPKYENQLLNTLSGVLSGTLSGLLLVWMLTDNEKKLSVEDVVKIIETIDSKEKKEIANQVYNTYQQIDVRQTINQTFEIVSRDKNITGLDIIHNEKKIVSVPKEEFKKYIREVDELPEEKEIAEKNDIVEVSIIIKTVHFEGNAKWGFIWNGYPIKASLKDERFISRLNSETFKRGDILKVRLKKKSVFNEDLNTYIVDEKNYEIIEVLNHISRSENQDYELTMDE